MSYIYRLIAKVDIIRVMRNFLFASIDFLDARNAHISAQKINHCLFSCANYIPSK